MGMLSEVPDNGPNDFTFVGSAACQTLRWPSHSNPIPLEKNISTEKKHTLERAIRGEIEGQTMNSPNW